MIRTHAYAVTSLLILLSLMSVSAVPDAVGGLSVLIVEPGPDTIAKFKFPIAADDPGTHTYNVTFPGLGVEFDDVEANFTGTREDGFITFTFDITLAGSTDATVHAWDGSDEGAASCTVNVDASLQYDYDACGDMDPPRITVYCLSPDKEDSFGYAPTAVFGLKEDLGDIVTFRAAGKEAAYAGLNLGGDTVEYQFDFEVETDTDGGSSKILMFFSSVDVDASTTSAADASVVVASGFTVPNEGAFTDGYGVVFVEDGNDYNVNVFHNTDGATTYITQLTIPDNPNNNNLGTFKYSEYESLIQVTMGASAARFHLPDHGPGASAFHTFWVSEYGSGVFNFAQHFHKHDDTSGCFSSITPTLGGASAATGAPSSGQALEDFTGQGGYVGQPVYPFVDTAALQVNLGIADIAFRTFLYVVGVLTPMVIIGAAMGRGTGALVAASISIPVGIFMGLTPYWAAILLFMPAMHIIMTRGMRT